MAKQIVIKDRHEFVVLTKDEFIERMKLLCPNGIQEIIVKGERLFILCHDRCMEDVTNAIYEEINNEEPPIINIKNRKQQP